MRKKTLNYVLVGLSLGILLSSIYYKIYISPSNSVELYRSIYNADEYGQLKQLMAGEETEGFSQTDYEYIRTITNNPQQISQFTLLSYQDTAYLIRTTPGTEKLKIIRVNELSDDLQAYFQEFIKD